LNSADEAANRERVLHLFAGTKGGSLPLPPVPASLALWKPRSWSTLVAMPVDVQTEIEIDRPRSEVSSYAADPDTATTWYENIKAVEWRTPKPLAVGSRIAFVAQFLGRRLAYTYEIKELVPGARLVMRTADGPFPMETTYTWDDTADDRTKMTLRNRGEPSGFATVAAPMMARAMRRANRKDLRRLKGILESQPRQPSG